MKFRIHYNGIYEDSFVIEGETIKEMITYHVIMANIQFNVAYIWGGDIPGLKAKWEEWVTKKDKMKKVDVTMLRMEEGE